MNINKYIFSILSIFPLVFLHSDEGMSDQQEETSSEDIPADKNTLEDQESINSQDNVNKKDIPNRVDLSSEPTKQKSKSPIGLEVEFRPAYFYPQSSTLRKIYSGGYITLAEVSYTFYDNLYVWVEPGYFHKKGTIKEVPSNVSTTITQVPVSAGLGYTYHFLSRFEVSGQIGPNYLYTNTKQHSSYFKHVIAKNTFGATIGISSKCRIYDELLLGVFANYRYDKKEVHDSLSGTNFSVYLGGFDFGASLGYRF